MKNVDSWKASQHKLAVIYRDVQDHALRRPKIGWNMHASPFPY